MVAFFHSLFLRLRLLASLLTASLVYAGLMEWPAGKLEWPTRLLLTWNSGMLLYLAMALILMRRSNIANMKKRAGEEDDGAIAVLGLTLAAAFASLGAIAAELASIHNQSGQGQALHLLLAGGTILLSWFFVQITFSLHYAHEYYGDCGERQGVEFPGTKNPDYWDFLYFATNVGAALQTSDVQIRSRTMRRLVLVQTIIAFLFNTTIVALAVNIGAGLI